MSSQENIKKNPSNSNSKGGKVRNVSNFPTREKKPGKAKALSASEIALAKEQGIFTEYALIPMLTLDGIHRELVLHRPIGENLSKEQLELTWVLSTKEEFKDLNMRSKISGEFKALIEKSESVLQKAISDATGLQIRKDTGSLDYPDNIKVRRKEVFQGLPKERNLPPSNYITDEIVKAFEVKFENFKQTSVYSDLVKKTKPEYLAYSGILADKPQVPVPYLKGVRTINEALQRITLKIFGM
jgi:hypothetical protein